MSDLSNNLKKYRTETEMNQQEVAEKANISRRAYSSYETGDREPDVETLIKLANIFNESIDILVGRYIKNK